MASVALALLLMKCGEWLAKDWKMLTAYDVDEKVRSLQDKLSWLLACIKDADKNKRRENERAKLWVSQIIDIAHDAEDAIDSFTHMAHQTKRPRFSNLLWSPLRQEAKKIDSILKRIDEIISNRSHFGIENPHVGGGTDSDCLGMEELLPPAIANKEMNAFCMGDDALFLAEKLIQGTEQRHVVSIVGMGGIGKTTLAKIVYNRDDVMENFECRAWVYVCQEYKIKDILEGIIKCIFILTKDDLKLLQRMNESDLRRRLHQHLEGKTYLVVLDDIWHKEAWDGLEAAFPAETTRSRVLLTTRNQDVALHADAKGSLHQPGFLEEEESWNLFRQKAFPKDISHSCPSHLEKLGREIVSKCGGLPLAIATLGKLFLTKGNLTREWAKVGKMVHWQFQQEECKLTRSLNLSYLDLPYHLKSCFLYFSAFPKGFQIQASTLIKLWIAEGYIMQKGEEPIEETAEDCLNELISRSMIQVTKVNSYGGVKTCRIHDLMRELAISTAKEDKFLEVCENVLSTSPTKVRRLAITYSNSQKCIHLNHNYVHLRSLLCFSDNQFLEKDEWASICGCFKLLRVLSLENVRISHSIAGIENLIHLRYLGLRDSCIECFPSSISNLYSLQTLDLRNNNNAEFPDEIWKLKQLRHLRLEVKHATRYGWDGKALIPEHVELSHFVNLQTLTGVRAGNWMDAGMERLTNLRKLAIDGVTEEYKELFAEFKLTKLKSLKFSTLTEYPISLSSFPDSPNLYSMYLVGVLERLTGPHQFPPYLTKLTLCRSKMGQDSLATLEKLQNLSTLKLKAGSYVGHKMIFTEGGFPRLQVLTIDSIIELEELIAEEGAIPGLTHIEIIGCPRLKVSSIGYSDTKIIDVEGNGGRNKRNNVKDGNERRHSRDSSNVQKTGGRKPITVYLNVPHDPNGQGKDYAGPNSKNHKKYGKAAQ